MVYHIFSYCIDGVWYRDSTACSDEQFEHILDKLGWRLPKGITVYHYGTPGRKHYRLNNPVMLARPILALDPLQLIQSSVHGRVDLLDQTQNGRYTVTRQLGRFAIAEDPLGGWPRFFYVDGGQIRLQADMTVVPIPLRTARAYVHRFHRHNDAPQGHKFSIGLAAAGSEELIGVAIASIPKARALHDGLTLEVSRVCCDPAYVNACSKLYAAVIRAGRAQGYRRFVTYTLPDESGSSLRAVGFRPDAMTTARPDGWNCPSRPRALPSRYPVGEKIRWMLTTR